MEADEKDNKKRKHALSDLIRFYSQSSSIDKVQFAEMRSNLLLVNGEHYNRYYFDRLRQRVRDHSDLNEIQKLRLVKNHVQRIVKNRVNCILSTNPGIGFMAHNDAETQSRKAAELNKSVWDDARNRYVMDEKIYNWAFDFESIGECATKIFWDPQAGELMGYEPQTDAKGNPEREDSTFNPSDGTEIPGEMIADLTKPVFAGEFIFEKVYGFNLFRPQECKDLKEAQWLGIRKMVNLEDLKNQFPDKEEKIYQSADETFKVLDFSFKNPYRDSRNECMVMEIYFRPCRIYPLGYYYIYTKECILDEGELPGGIFPIIWEPNETLQTTPRGISAIKHMRPYQIEINRAASKIAEHQISVGDDKVITINGSKLSAGITMSGIRHLTATGQAPIVLPGRDGSQYLPYMESQIKEMYDVMDLSEQYEPNQNTQDDPLVALFKSAKSRRRFQNQISKFERFLMNIAKTYLKLARIYFDENRFIKVVGRNEFVNISEFKNTSDLDFQVVIEPQSEDIETKYGKQMVLNNALQFIGSKLDKEDIGKLLREMPFSNLDDAFDDMTADYDSGTNMILALDRGETPDISNFDDPTKLAKRLVARMRQADFKLLNPQIQQNYQMFLTQFDQLKSNQDRKTLALQADMIPTDGPLCTVQGFFVKNPSNPTGTQQVRLPMNALTWLVDRLNDQGVVLDDLNNLNSGQRDQITDMMLANQGGLQGLQGGMNGQAASGGYQ